MKRSEFNSRIKGMLKDMKDGFYGETEFFDEIWSYIYEEQLRNNDLWRKVKRLRKKVGIKDVSHT